MAALDFPSSPSVNQVYTANGYSWYWNGTAWVSYAYINGGTINNTSIGATTPSTGAFTTLSSSSTTTLNGTTIPASKTLVVTTDKLSALAATTSSELAGVISDETGSGSLVFATSPTLVTPNLGTPSAIVLTNASGTASININGTVGATTANVGYFTTISATNNITTSGGYVGYAVTGTIHAISSTGYNGPVGATTANTGAFTTLAASGGVTSGGRVQITGGGSDPASGSGLELLGGATPNIVVYNRTGGAWLPLSIQSGTQTFNVSGSTVATLTSTGLNSTAIGATTPSTGAFTTLSATGDVTASGGNILSTSGGAIPIRVSGATTGYSVMRIGNTGGEAFFGQENSSGNNLIVGCSAYDTILRGPSGIAFSANAGSAMQMRLSSTGLAVTGTVSTNSGILFTATAGLNYGFDSAGKTIVLGYGSGGTANFGSVDIYDGKTGLVGRFTSTGLAVTGTTASTSSASGTTTFNSNNTGGSGDRYHLVCRESGTERGSITSNGSATSFNTSSDARLKTNIRDYSAGDLIDLLKPRLFDWKSGEKDSIGFVAQELAEVYPHAVTAGDDGEEITQQWGVDFSKLVPVLVAELKSVRARLAALEAQ